MQSSIVSAKTSEMSLSLANSILESAIEKAGQLGVSVNIAVVDASSFLKAFARIDGANLGSIDIALKKARTALLFGIPSGEIGKLSQPGGPLFSIEHSNGGLITFTGGTPVKSPNGIIIGAIGVSGSTVENDLTISLAGAANEACAS